MALKLIEYVKENQNAFEQKVRRIAKKLDILPEWLMLLMFHESGLNHRSTNFIACGGLIGFCPGGGLAMVNKTLEQVISQSNVQQLEDVYTVLKGRKYKSFRDLHLFTFYPVAYQHHKDNPNFVIGSEKSDAWAKTVQAQNHIFDVNKDGYITIGDFNQYAENLQKKYGIPTKKGFSVNAKSIQQSMLIVAIILAILVFLYRKEVQSFYQKLFQDVRKFIPNIQRQNA